MPLRRARQNPYATFVPVRRARLESVRQLCGDVPEWTVRLLNVELYSRDRGLPFSVFGNFMYGSLQSIFVGISWRFPIKIIIFENKIKYFYKNFTKFTKISQKFRIFVIFVIF